MLSLVQNKYIAGIVLSGLLLGFGFLFCVALMSAQGGEMSGMDMSNNTSCVSAPLTACFFSASLSQMMHWQDIAFTSESVLASLVMSIAVVLLLLPFIRFLLSIHEHRERIRKRHGVVAHSLTELFSQGILNPRLFA